MRASSTRVATHALTVSAVCTRQSARSVRRTARWAALTSGRDSQVVWVAGAAVDQHGRRVVQDGGGTRVPPPLPQLRAGLGGDMDGDVPAANVRGPVVQRNRADQRRLIQRQRQRRIQPATRLPGSDPPGLQGDVAGEGGDQRGDLGVLGAQPASTRRPGRRRVAARPGRGVLARSRTPDPHPARPENSRR